MSNGKKSLLLTLEVKTKKGKRKVERRLFIDKEIQFGRGDFGFLPEADLNAISAKHFKISCSLIDGRPRCTIRDTNSTNGTALGGNDISDGKPRELKDGDVIDLARGAAVMTIRLGEVVEEPMPELGRTISVILEIDAEEGKRRIERELPAGGEIWFGRMDFTEALPKKGELSFISGKHFKISYSLVGGEPRCMVQDAGSTNGTALNGEDISDGKPRELKDGDVIDLARGAAVMTVRIWTEGVETEEAEGIEAPPVKPKGIFEKLGEAFRSFLSNLNPLSAAPRAGAELERELRAEPLVPHVSGDVLEEYTVEEAEVYISKGADGVYYLIKEPPLSKEEREIYRDIMEDIYYSLRLDAAHEPMKHLQEAIWKSASQMGRMEEVRRAYSKYRYFLERDVIGYGKLHIPMMDPNVEEISLSSPEDYVRVLHRKFTEFGWLQTNIRFGSDLELQRYNSRLSQRLGESLTAAVPMINATTREGHRVALTFGDEVTGKGSSLTIRKHPEEPIVLPFLVFNRTISSKAAAYLWQILEWKGYVNIIGGIGGGKTTLMNALLGTLNPNSKKVTIEDGAAEIRLPSENWQSFITRPARYGMGEEYEVDLFDLVKEAMRHRPDYLTIGESRGEEVKILTHAAALGHSCTSTFHSKSPEDAITRMKAHPMNLSDSEILLIWCFTLVNQITKPSGEVVRRVLSIHEVNPTKDGKPGLDEIFRFSFPSDSLFPDDFSTIVKRSRRLRDAAKLRGMSEKDVIKLLKKKSAFIEELVRKKEFGFRNYTEKIRDFYLS